MTESEKEKLNPTGINAWTQNGSTSRLFNVVRRVYQQEDLDKDADYHKPKTNLTKQAKSAVTGCGFGDFLKKSLPPITWLPKYKIQRDLLGDIIAGCTTAIMHIPQGMAYAILAEVPAIVGLYMAFFPVLVYVVFGTSPHVSMGTFAVACLMSGKVVNMYATHEPIHTDPPLHNASALFVDPDAIHYTPIQVLTAVTFMVGVFQVVMWAARLGAVASLLSDPLVSGFTTAASFHVLSSQLKDLFGVKLTKFSGNFKIVFTVIEVCQKLPDLNWAAFIISFIYMLIISLNNELLKPWVSKRSRVPVPIELIAVVTGTLISRFANVHTVYGLNLVGEIPTGLPAPAVPPLELLSSVAIESFTITMVTYTISMSMALTFASRDKYEIDANQELLAMGGSNIFGSFFACAPLCASLSRSYIQYQVGGKTMLSSLVSSALLLMVLLWIGPFFEDLPRCVLAAIIVVALKGMFMQVKDLVKFWKLSKLDALVWLVTFIVVILIDIDIGLLAGIIASVGSLFFRAQQPYTCLLGRVQETDLYMDVKRYKAAEEIPGIKIFHYCGGLNFATKNLFRTTLFRKVGFAQIVLQNSSDEDSDVTKPSQSSTWDQEEVVRCVIIDVTALSYVDAPGVKMLRNVHFDLSSQNVNVLLAGANGPVLEMIERYNKLECDQLKIDTYPTVHDAVIYFQAQQRKLQNTAITIS